MMTATVSPVVATIIGYEWFKFKRRKRCQIISIRSAGCG
jgi:hypothetical protein